MIIAYCRNVFIFIGNHITKTVIGIIYAGGVAVVKTLWVVGGIGYGLQLVGGVGIGQIIYFYGLSQFFLSVAFQRGDVAVFVIGQVFGILSVTTKVYKKRWPTQCF